MSRPYRRYVLLILFGCALCAFLGGLFSSNDMVATEFSWLLNHNATTHRWMLLDKQKDWCRRYKVPESEMSYLHSRDFVDCGYLGWQRFSGIFIMIGGHVIDGKNHTVFVNEKKGSDDFDFIRMYLDFDRSELILIYGKTYGR